jgi:hypothetical protein
MATLRSLKPATADFLKKDQGTFRTVVENAETSRRVIDKFAESVARVYTSFFGDKTYTKVAITNRKPSSDGRERKLKPPQPTPKKFLATVEYVEDDHQKVPVMRLLPTAVPKTANVDNPIVGKSIVKAFVLPTLPPIRGSIFSPRDEANLAKFKKQLEDDYGFIFHGLLRQFCEYIHWLLTFDFDSYTTINKSALTATLSGITMKFFPDIRAALQQGDLPGRFYNLYSLALHQMWFDMIVNITTASLFVETSDLVTTSCFLFGYIDAMDTVMNDICDLLPWGNEGYTHAAQDYLKIQNESGNIPLKQVGVIEAKPGFLKYFYTITVWHNELRTDLENLVRRLNTQSEFDTVQRNALYDLFDLRQYRSSNLVSSSIASLFTHFRMFRGPNSFNAGGFYDKFVTYGKFFNGTPIHSWYGTCTIPDAEPFANIVRVLRSLVFLIVARGSGHKTPEDTWNALTRGGPDQALSSEIVRSLLILQRFHDALQYREEVETFWSNYIAAGVPKAPRDWKPPFVERTFDTRAIATLPAFGRAVGLLSAEPPVRIKSEAPGTYEQSYPSAAGSSSDHGEQEEWFGDLGHHDDEQEDRSKMAVPLSQTTYPPSSSGRSTSSMTDSRRRSQNTTGQFAGERPKRDSIGEPIEGGLIGDPFEGWEF